MDKEVILAFIGILGTLAGVIKWILTEYFKQANIHEDKRHQNAEKEISHIKETLEEFQKRLSQSDEVQKKTVDKLNHVHSMISTYTDVMRRVYENHDKQYEGLKTTVIQIGKEIQMLKGRK